MDASVYFRLSDRIDAARSLDELAALREDIDSVRPHAIERRALERRIERRERLILLPLGDAEVHLAGVAARVAAAGDVVGEVVAARTDRSGEIVAGDASASRVPPPMAG